MHSSGAAAIVEVSRLAAPTARQMAAACLATEDLPDALNPLLASCNGLPFAIEEMLAAAVVAGELVKSHAAGWWIAASTPLCPRR